MGRPIELTILGPIQSTHRAHDVCFVRVLHCEPAVVFWCDPPRAREPDGRSTLWPSSPRPSLPCTAIRLYGYTALRSTALRLCGYTAAAVYLCTFVHLVNLILPEFLCFTFVPCAIVVVVPPPVAGTCGPPLSSLFCCGPRLFLKRPACIGLLCVEKNSKGRNTHTHSERFRNPEPGRTPECRVLSS